MIYVVKYLLVFDMVIGAFLALRVSEWFCRLVALFASGKRSEFHQQLNETRSFRSVTVRAGTIGLLVMTAAIINWAYPISQIVGLSTLGLLLAWRWLYFVKHPPFAMGALGIAMIMPLLVIAKGMQQ